MKSIPNVPSAHQTFIIFYYYYLKGTRLELQLRNGCYDFLPVLNLMLLAVPTIAEVSKRLNFPSLTSKFFKLFY